jgi:hypothetical protein
LLRSPKYFGPGFRSEEHRAKFIAGIRANARGGPLARICGAQLKSGAHCTDVCLSGEQRCRKHCGPDAARRFRERQLADYQRGSVSPDVWNRAEERRARNQLNYAWRKDPHLPGQTIDLGSDEMTFRHAVLTLGTDTDVLCPAVGDWLRWRWQRTQSDRTDGAAWLQAVRDELPRKSAAAAAAAALADLGVKDWRTKKGRAVKAALRAEGIQGAQAELKAPGGVERVSEALAGGTKRPGQLTMSVVRPWSGATAADAWKRRLPDASKPKVQTARPCLPKQMGRPRQGEVSAEELASLMDVLWKAGPEVRRMFSVIASDQEQVAFLQDLRACVRAPEDVKARTRWIAWATAIRHA